MARKTIVRVVSDLSGKELSDKEAWTMLLSPPDGRANKVQLDLSADEAREFAAKGTEIKRRGRPKGSKNK